MKYTKNNLYKKNNRYYIINIHYLKYILLMLKKYVLIIIRK